MTTQGFLAWEDRQEGKFEFNLLAERPFRVAHQMRLRIDSRVGYADVVVCAGPLDQSTRTVTDAIAIVEVTHTAEDLVLPGINSAWHTT